MSDHPAPRRGGVSESLRHGLGELLIVVAGVLIALWANAAWQNHTDRQTEREHLVALRGDFEASLRLLDSTAVLKDRQAADLRRLLEGGARSGGVDSAEAWAHLGLWNIVDFPPQLSALRDLETSGDIRLIQGIELRRVLADIDHLSNQWQVEQNDFSATQQRLIDPHLVEDLDLAHVLSSDKGVPRPIGPDRTDWRVLETRAWKSRIAFKLALIPYSEAPLVTFRDRLTRAIELIDRRLTELGRPVDSAAPGTAAAAGP